MGEMIYTLSLENGIGSIDVVHDEYAEEFDEFLTLEKFNAVSNEITCEIQGWQPEIDNSKIINWLYNEYPCRIKRWNP